MSQRTIATQTQLESVNFELSQLSDNLASHANTDLSDAHGFNVIYGPVNDGHGNDISVYKDSRGDIVGAFMLSITINGNRVFVPMQSTTLPGKPSSTGLDVSVVTDPQTGAGASNWVTQFDDTLTALVQSILENFLLPHTLTGYWEAHGGLVLVNPELAHKGVAGSGTGAGWHDSHQDLVARASLKLNADGFNLRIPCETRLGGPFQTTTLGPFSPGSIYHEIDSGAASPQIWNYPINPVVLSGVKPFTYAYKYLDSGGNWQPISAGITVQLPIIYDDPGEGESITDYIAVNYSSTTGQLIFVRSDVFQEQTLIRLTVRVIVTGADGNPVELTTSNVYPTFSFQVRRLDNDD